MRTLEAFAVEKADEENDEAIDRELERVHQKVQQLQKEKDILANQLEEKERFRKS
jgi:DNA-binding GntR family transcriptional regulator